MQYIQNRQFSENAYEVYRVYLGLGTVAARQARASDATNYLQKALEYNPRGDGAYAQLGGVLLMWGHNSGEAIALLQKAIRLSAVNELARDYLGVALVNQGHYEEGIKYFREALQLNPELKSAKQHLELALQGENQR